MDPGGIFSGSGTRPRKKDEMFTKAHNVEHVVNVSNEEFNDLPVAGMLLKV